MCDKDSCETRAQGGCKIYPNHARSVRYTLAFVGFLPAILIFFVKDYNIILSRSIANEPYIYPCVIGVVCLLVLYFSWLVGRKPRFQEFDYLKTTAAYGTAVVALLAEIVT